MISIPQHTRMITCQSSKQTHQPMAKNFMVIGRIASIVCVLLLGLSYAATAQLTYVPDNNFEQALIDLGYDSGPLDNYVPTANINTVTSLYVNSKGISDLTGIEGFTALEVLNCANNNLSSLNVSENSNLNRLECQVNLLKSLNVSQNLNLTLLYCHFNDLSGLDVSNNINLRLLYAYNNALSSITVTGLTALISLQTQYNELTSLDVSSNTALDALNCSYNKLTNLNLNGAHNLRHLNSRGNFSLTTLNVSNNLRLEFLDCRQNPTTGIDVRNNIQLRSFICTANNLKSLDVTNNINLTSLFCDGNPNFDGVLDLSNNLSLAVLDCSNSNLNNLNLSKNSDLVYLNCSSNKIETLDLRDNVKLKELQAQSNKIVNLDLTGISTLKILKIYLNLLTDFPDFSSYPNKENLDIDVRWNYLDFADLEQNLLPPDGSSPFYKFAHFPQHDLKEIIPIDCGSDLTIINNKKGGSHTNYQWKRYIGGALYSEPSWENIPGATTADLPSPGGYPYTHFRCHMTNDWVQGILHSSIFQFPASVAPTIMPSGPFFLCGSETQMLSVTETYEVYQWYKDGVAITGATNSTFPASQSGNYTVVSCGYESAPVTVTYYSNPIVTVVEQLPTNCKESADGEMTISVSGGTGSYSYEVRNASDAVVASGTAEENTNITVNGLSIGKHNWVINNAAAPCDPIQKPFTITNGGPLVTLCASSLVCNTTNSSSLKVTVKRARLLAGDTYNYEVRDINQQPVVSGSGVFNQEISPKPEVPYTGAGYTFHVMAGADNACTATQIKFKITLAEMAIALDNPSGMYYQCAQGLTNVKLTPKLSATTCTEATGTFSVTVNKDGQPFQTLDNQTAPITLTNLQPGKYTANVTGDYGTMGTCQATTKFEIKTTLVTARVIVSDPLCADPGDDGRATAQVTGGAAPYAYKWYQGTTLLSTLPEVNSLSAGTYRLELTGANCTQPFISEFEVTAPTPLGTVSIQPPVTGCDMTATLSNAGGTAPYTFYWITLEDVEQVQSTFNETTQKWETTTQTTTLETVAWVDKGVTATNSEAISYTTTNVVKHGDVKVKVADNHGCEIVSDITTITQPEVIREYNLCFRWKTRAVEEGPEPDPDLIVINSTNIASSSMSKNIMAQANKCVTAKSAAFTAAFDIYCLSTEHLHDEVTLTYELATYHHTLYYYDRAGNLARTVPPKGVTPLAPGSISRNNTPAHTLVTGYDYNSLGQLVRQNTPDGGTSGFIYNNLGQLRFSQNAKQALVANNTISYTKYDELARIVEVGEAHLGTDYTTPANGVFPTNTFNDLDNETLLNLDKESYQSLPIADRYPTAAHGLSEQTLTSYNTPLASADYNGQPQSYLRNRVSYTEAINASGDVVTTSYSYDAHGNVKWLQQDIPGLGSKRIGYDYDLISGNVLKVKYNEGQPDQFFHKYGYDEDNRITEVYTSQDGIIWEQDASYEYFAHGPLKRTLIGQHKVQGLDYTYTIHGWLKAINNPTNEGQEIGQVAQDAFGMMLGYYQGDFSNSGSPFSSAGQLPATEGRDLYNGNISSWQLGTPASDLTWMRTGFQYTYDRLNRIRSSVFNVQKEGSFYARSGFSADYELDPNGNLEHLKRHDIDGGKMDVLEYHLTAGTNRLDHVNDLSTMAADKHNNDLENQNAGNYLYDPIGNLVHDNQEDMDIDWSIYGKVRQTQKAGSGAITGFVYDAAGNRVAKKTTDEHGNLSNNYYVRDASGNVMAVYKEQTVNGTSSIKLHEVPIYGSDRLGMWKPGGGLSNSLVLEDEVQANQLVNAYDGTSYKVGNEVELTLQPGFVFEAGVDGNLFSVSNTGQATGQLDNKLYELKDHLGNIRAVVTDRKQGDVSGGTPQDIKPTMASATAYYPYGMDMPTVKWGEEVALATYEAEKALDEYSQFQNYTEAWRINSEVFNHTECEGCIYPTIKSQLLTGQTGSIIGLSKSLRVQNGDQVLMEVYGKYFQPEADAPFNAIAASLGSAFINAFNVPLSSEGMPMQDLFNDLFSAGSIFGTSTSDNDVKAYMNYLLFDDNFVLQDAGYMALTAAAQEDGSEREHELLALDIPISHDGYMYIYLSNESPRLSEVYFDDFKVTHKKLVPDDAYNPDLIAYRYGFNGKEKDQSGEWGLNHYDYGFRIYNPALGRFLSVDPLTKTYPMLTPYQFASNRPIDGVDLDGLEYVHYGIYLDTDGKTIIKKDFIKDYRNMSDSEIRQNFSVSAKHYYQANSQSHGPAGEGVAFTYFQKNENGGFDQLETRMEQAQNFTYQRLTVHGMFYGAGSVTKFGPKFGKGYGKYDFASKPIDMVDQIAKLHDMEEDVPNFKDYGELRFVGADIRFVNRLKGYLKAASEEGYIDPYTGRPASGEALTAAANGIGLFEDVVKSKKGMIDSGYKSGGITKQEYDNYQRIIRDAEATNK